MSDFFLVIVRCLIVTFCKTVSPGRPGLRVTSITQAVVRLRKPLSVLLCPMSEHWGKWSRGCHTELGPVGKTASRCVARRPARPDSTIDVCVAAAERPDVVHLHSRMSGKKSRKYRNDTE